ncbi:MAG: carbohydrate kinase family protein [Alicyclobacillaceae bacterium]|nr:carbohydrate kinase family protein [Alicyclobacillaceae bacterium]
MLVVGIGNIHIDHRIHVPALPQRGMEVRAQRKDTTIGGSAVTTAKVLGWLGYPVRLVGAAGRSDLEGEAGRVLREAGVDLTHVQPVSLSAETYVLVDPSGERTMVSFEPPGSRYVLGELPERALDGATWVFMSAYSFVHQSPSQVAKFLDTLQARGIALAVNLCPILSAISGDVLRRVCECAAVVSGNEREWLALTGCRSRDELVVKVRALTKAGHRRQSAACYITRGAGGSSLVSPDETVRLPSVAALSGYDTTGAGDGFFAGVLAAVFAGRTGAETLRAGAWVATRLIREQWLRAPSRPAGWLVSSWPFP